jgi:hypothetical protein
VVTFEYHQEPEREKTLYAIKLQTANTREYFYERFLNILLFFYWISNEKTYSQEIHVLINSIQKKNIMK